MSKVNLVTVTGHHTHTLPHMINHYKDIVDEVYVVVYMQSENDSILNEVKSLGIDPFKVVIDDKFNWERVTELYNEVKLTKPDEWWIVSDDDEFQIYPKPLHTMIQECEDNGWKFITGGFLDRLGKGGTFPEIKKDSNIWELFPLGGFFRHPISDACPNKVCVMKGDIQVTSGQHYATIDDKTVWGIEGTKHEQRYPIEDGFIQVHHFKWDHTVVQRLKEVSDIKEDYTYWWEYKKMLDFIIDNGYILDIYTHDFNIEKVYNSYNDYSQWEEITNKIIRI